MSITKNFDEALSLVPAEDREGLIARLSASAAVYWSGLRDGLAAARMYQDLMRRGTPHDVAVKKVFERHLA